MFEMIILVFKIATAILAIFLTQNIVKNAINSKRYYSAAFLVVLIWGAVIGISAQEFRSRNFVAKQITGKQAETTMTQKVYVRNENIAEREPDVDKEAIFEANQKSNEATKERFENLETE